MAEKGPRQILLVDADEGLRSALLAALTNNGFAVTVAGNVSDALRKANRTNYDVLVADLNIEDPDDGLLVVAAMHLFHPKCLNLD